MNSKKFKCKRILAGVMSAAMLFQFTQVNVFAQGGTGEEKFKNEVMSIDNICGNMASDGITSETTIMDISKDSSSNEIINIPDQNLKIALNKALSQPEDSDITKEQLEAFTSINLKGNNISNLEGLQYCINAGTIDLSGNQISDLTPLKDLINLEILDAATNNISDIGALSNLTKMKVLVLHNNNISDIQGLKNMTELMDLNLGYNNISDVSPIENAKGLTILVLRMNSINNIEPLKDLTSLFGLSLENNPIEDISALNNMKDMNILELRSTKISDITPLKNMKDLAMLRLSNNEISDLTPLKDMSKLMLLYLENNKISDITPLANMGKLVDLSLWNQKVVLPEQKFKSNLEIENTIKSVDGESISPENISGSGIYDATSNKIKWENIENDVTNETYTFKKSIRIGESISDFSGTVEQPIAFDNSTDKPNEDGSNDNNTDNTNPGGTNTDSTKPNKTEGSNNTVSPKTGDVGALGYMCLGTISLAGLVIGRRKNRK